MAKKMKKGVARKNKLSSPPLDATNSEPDSAPDCPTLEAISDAIPSCASMAEDTPPELPSEASQGEACADEAPPDEAPPDEAPSDGAPAEEMLLDEDNRPGTSPYTTPIYTLFVGPNGTPYTVPQHFLRQSPNLSASMENAYWTSNNISLPELDESIGHTLVHYLHTGTYQTLKLQDVSRAAARIEEYKRGILAYFAARLYGLDGLVAHAKEAIVKFESPMTIFEILDIVKELYPKSVDDDEVWFSDHLKVNIADAFYEDATLFTQERFLHYIGGAAAFDRILFKSVAEICTEKITRMERKEEPSAEGKPAEDQRLLATVELELALCEEPAAVEEPTAAEVPTAAEGPTADEFYPEEPTAAEEPSADELYPEEPTAAEEPTADELYPEDPAPEDPAPEDPLAEECPCGEPAEAPAEAPAEECPYEERAESPAEPAPEEYPYEEPAECSAEPAPGGYLCEELASEECLYEELALEECPCEEPAECPAEEYPCEEPAESVEPALEECLYEELAQPAPKEYPYEEPAKPPTEEPPAEEDPPCKEPALEPESVVAESEPTTNPWLFWGLPQKSRKNGARHTFEGRPPSPPAEPQLADEPDVEENSMCPSGAAHFKNGMWRDCNRCRAFVRHMFAQLANEGELDMDKYEFVDKMLLN